VFNSAFLTLEWGADLRKERVITWGYSIIALLHQRRTEDYVCLKIAFQGTEWSGSRLCKFEQY